MVLDTNVMLDVWLFGDARAATLAQALGKGHLQHVATAAMLEELRDVLGRPALARWAARVPEAWAAITAHCAVVARPDAPDPALPRCEDPDDQMFIDLACCLRLPWLVSRDKAVLKLARAARAWGVSVIQPFEWQAKHP